MDKKTEYKFELEAPFKPSGDQPEAIRQIVEALENGEERQTLLGVTGSGKTFTMANVIKETQRPTLIISHNKTLAAQLYGEFKEFFPNNLVEYFISYYDYYQPEAFVASSNTYIEKDLQINQDIEKLRLRATTALTMGRRDVVVIASVSCIYGIGDIDAYTKQVFNIKKDESYVLEDLLKQLVDIQFTRGGADFKSGNFIVQ